MSPTRTRANAAIEAGARLTAVEDAMAPPIGPLEAVDQLRGALVERTRLIVLRDWVRRVAAPFEP